MTYRLSIFTQYGQFFIADKDASYDTGRPDFWNNDAFNNRLAFDDGIIGVSIENDEAIANMEIEILDSQADLEDLDMFDHVAEGSLLIKSGILQILDCPNLQVELEFNLEPDCYKVRVCFSNLEKAHVTNPEDKYFIKIWKEKYSKPKVIKHWHRSKG